MANFTAGDIASLRQTCLTLPGGEILDRYTDAQAADICNGVGAAWADKVAPKASAILNRALPWAVAPSVIHDLAYHEGGNEVMKFTADYQFWVGCCQCIEWCSSYAITRWWRERKAWKLYLILRAFGKFAWSNGK